MSKRIVIALGGNALGSTAAEQLALVSKTAKAIVDLIAEGNEVVIAHGNGPQVGMIQNAFAAYCRQEPSADVMPLSMCVAMSQGYIGYDLQNMIGEFNLARMDLNNEIGKNERDDARIAELNEKVNSLYGQIMGNEGMVAYNEAKRECENLVNYIDAIINTAMNGGDPMTVQEPSASCTGSCSTCGGCH